MMELVSLTTPTYAVMAQRRFLDRVKDAMLPETLDWNRCNSAAGVDSKKRRLEEEEDIKDSSRCVTVATPDVSGGRKDRQGYTLLVICGSTARPQDLHAITRMNISWAAKLTIRATTTTTSSSVEVDGFGRVVNSVAASAFDDMRNKMDWIFTEATTIHKLRVDTFPKELSENLCRALQCHARKHMEQHTTSSSSSSNELVEDYSADDPFSGPIQFTRSASQCTHILSFIQTSTSEGYYGISTKDSHFANLNNLFNHNAKREVIIEPTHPDTGIDLNSVSNGGEEIASNIPVSRAYYKLSQLVNDYLGHDDRDFLDRGSGLDLGASPGGWTQVLSFQIGCKTVVAVDPARLANRVEKAKGVVHIKSDLAKKDTIVSISKHSPYSFVVCDASLNNFEVLEKVCEMFEGMSGLFSENSNEDNNAAAPSSFSGALTLPAAVVVTLKFPYKTAGSIKKNLGIVLETIPRALQRISVAAYGDDQQDRVGISYKVLHLMANSDSERTLLVKFDTTV